MLLTNVTRSASYEALPHHRLFPARSGLTSRFPLRNRCLWEKADETAAKTLQRGGEGQEFLGGDQLPAAATLEKRNAPEKRKSGDAVGRPSCRSSLLGDPGAKFLVEAGHPNRTMKNLSQGR
jgi:hypothetical protein